MKKRLLSLSALVFLSAQAQDCTNLFISEYVEGWSNNKAIEIYNPTSSAINLSGYFVARYSNGSTTAAVKNATQLSGTIAPYSTYVGVLDKRNSAGTGQEAPVWDSLQARADGFYTPVYNTADAFYWNGNDAIILAKGTLSTNANDNITTATGFQIIDIFGKIGEDPGTGWTTTAPYNNGMGTNITSDHSLIRKASVKKGVTTAVASFNALAEYDSIPAITYLFDGNGDTIETTAGNPKIFGNWFSLGEHECTCAPAAVKELEVLNVAFYPNPSTTGAFSFQSATPVNKIQIYNALGQLVDEQRFQPAQQGMYHGETLKGVYLVRFYDVSGATLLKRFVVK